MEGTKKIKSMSLHQYSWNSEVEKTWISLIDWHHKTSTIHVGMYAWLHVVGVCSVCRVCSSCMVEYPSKTFLTICNISAQFKGRTSEKQMILKVTRITAIEMQNYHYSLLLEFSISSKEVVIQFRTFKLR